MTLCLCFGRRNCHANLSTHGFPDGLALIRLSWPRGNFSITSHGYATTLLGIILTAFNTANVGPALRLRCNAPMPDLISLWHRLGLMELRGFRRD
jgi:hypothetical protein